jgi:hypothetical protein
MCAKLRRSLDALLRVQSPPIGPYADQGGTRRPGPQECQHQVEPDPAEMAARYGAETPVLDWRERLVCSKCGS